MIRSNDWHPDVWNLIDQPALRRIIGRNSHRHVNVVKLIHDLLPTNAVRQYTDPHTLPTCEKCDFDKATFSHLLRCSHPSRTRWRLGLLAALRTTGECQTTRLSLLQAILTGISSWFTGDLAPTVGFSPDVAQALHDQNEIGWYGFLRGFCSQRWAQIQQQHYSHNDLATNIINGDTWLSNMLTTIWTQLFRLWEEYTQELHGKTAAECRRHDRTTTQRQIRALHLFRTQVRAVDRQWFLPDLDHYCNTTGIASMKRWLATYEPIIHDAVRLAKATSIANTRPLRSYFPTTHQPRRPADRAARTDPKLHGRSINDARAQAKSRHKTPRPKHVSNTSIHRYFHPIHTPKPPPLPLNAHAE